jgi:hypothetical protein
MHSDHVTKMTPDEMKAAVAAYTGPITKIPTGKRTTRAPSKKPGQSGSLKGDWSAAQDRLAWGDQ